MPIVFSSSCSVSNHLHDNYWQLIGTEKPMRKMICFFSWKKYSFISNKPVSPTKTRSSTIRHSRHTKANLWRFTTRWMWTNSKIFSSMLLRLFCPKTRFGTNYSVAFNKTRSNVLNALTYQLTNKNLIAYIWLFKTYLTYRTHFSNITNKSFWKIKMLTHVINAIKK